MARKNGEKKRQKPQQYVISLMNNQMLDYRIYVMRLWERLLYFLIGAVAGALVGYVFYGDLFLADGVATQATVISNGVVCGLFAILAGSLFLPFRRNQLQKKRQATLRNQFRDLLASLSSSLSSGKNVTDSFLSARSDLSLQHSAQSYIVIEVDEILAGMQNNIPVENMLRDFAKRTGISDIEDFASVFEVCYRRGGNLKDVIRRTNEVLSDKMSCADEIETKLSSNKSQLVIMGIMPLGIMSMLRFTNSGFAQNFSSPAGVAAITVGIGLFLAAFYLGWRILRI